VYEEDVLCQDMKFRFADFAFADFALRTMEINMMKLTGIIGAAALSLFLGIALPARAQDQRDQEDKKQQEAKPAPQESKPPESKPAPHGREDKPAPREEKREEGARPQNEKREPENKPTPQEEKHGREDKPAPRPTPEDERRGQPQQQRDQPEERRRQDVRPPQEPQRPEQDRRQAQERPEHGRQDQGAKQSAFHEHRAKSWQSEHRGWRQRGGYHGTRIPEERFRASFGENHSFRISTLSFQLVSGSPAFLCNGFWVVLVDPIPEFWADDWFDSDDVFILWVDDGYYLFDRRYPSVAIAVSISA